MHKLWHEKNTHSIRNDTKPFPFYSFKKGPVHKCQIWALAVFFLKGKNIYSGSAFTIPGSGFDTTRCRNRNHNKLGGRLLARQGRLSWKRSPFVLSESPISQPPQLSLPRCWKRMEFLHRWRKISIEQCVFCISNLPPCPKASSQAFLELLLVTWPLSGWLFAKIHVTIRFLLLTLLLRFRWQHKASLVQKEQLLRMWASIFIIRAHTLQACHPKEHFFFLQLIWSPGELAWSHFTSLFFGQSWLIWQLKNCLLPIGKLLCPTIQWSCKAIKCYHSVYTYTHMHTHTGELWQED